ncbi:hypothetical protein UFOVP435_21 [uncultured Caudovirales phage]|uniref:Uncharacterized protein n=1 Tax=uncultured Caudovirales phage TaxID=2100421 RepID=A0A6J5MCA0_9CAUD|nr:hypothetical protein UFOVP435_21 [uncultured Caudovirales phage]
MPFTNSITGGPVQPANVGYRTFSLPADVTLIWPSIAQNLPDVVADLMEVAPTASGFNITLPDVRQVGVGSGTIIRNIGAFSFNVLDAGGGALAAIAPGVSRYLYITDQATAAGVWRSITLGASTSMADAASLVGAGIKAIGASLNQSMPPDPSASTSVFVVAADRARVKIAVGGVATYNLPNTSVVGPDWFCGFVNAGTGMLTLDCDGLETIDGQGSVQLAPGESTLVVCGGLAQYYTLGRGRSTAFNFTQLVKSIAPGGTTVLTSSESANKLMRFVGLLTGNATVEFPSTVGVYYLYNNTTGAFTVSVKTATGSPYALPQAQRAIVYCDGVDILPAQTAVPSGGVLFADGTQASPGMAYASETGLGLYRAAAATIGVAAQNADILRFVGVASAVNFVSFTNAVLGADPVVSTSGGALNLQGAVRIGSQISPTALGASVNNWAPVGIASCALIRVSSSTPVNITGIAVPNAAEGRLLTIRNVGSFDVTLTRDDAASSAANRFLIGANTVLRAGDSISLTYDATAQRWVCWGALPDVNYFFSGVGRRLVADFSNATLASRTYAQTGTINTSTSFGILPNGTGPASSYNAFGASDPTNASQMSVGVDATGAFVSSTRAGSGTFRPLRLATSDITRFEIDINGNIVVGTGAALAGLRIATIGNSNAAANSGSAWSTNSNAGSTSIVAWSAATGSSGFGAVQTDMPGGLSLTSLSATGAINFVVNGATRLTIRPDGSIWTNANTQPSFRSRVWGMFDGNTGGAFGVGNVSSLSKNAAGNYTINFAVAMPDTNYSTIATASIGSANFAYNADVIGRTTTGVQIVTGFNTGSVNQVDVPFLFVHVMR